jgi:hypothetical protein
VDELDRIFSEADQAGVHLDLSPESVSSVRGDTVLFDAVQVPIVAMAVVACVAGRRTGESVHALGARVGHTLRAAFPAFSRSGRYLQWSIRVRSVTADAIVFLEQSGLIVVMTDEERKVTLTNKGREFVQKVRASADAADLLHSLTSAATRTRNQDLRLL